MTRSLHFPSVLMALVLGLNLHIRTAIGQDNADVIGSGEKSTQPAPADPASEPLSLESSGNEKNAGVTEAAPYGFLFWPPPPPLEGTLSTDRPGFSDSVYLVPRGHMHLEAGYTYTYDQEDHAELSNHTFPETSLRMGITDDFELRVKWAGMSLTETGIRDISPEGRQYTNRQHDDGATDMSVGFKAPLLKQKGWIPNVSIIPSISIPTGAESKTSGDVDPSLELVWNYAVTKKLQIYGIGIVSSISDSDGRFCQSAASFAGYYQITDKTGFFLEYYGIYPSTRHGDCQHNINGGPVFLITDNFQIDVRVGMGLNEEAPDFFTGIGFGIRF